MDHYNIITFLRHISKMSLANLSIRNRTFLHLEQLSYHFPPLFSGGGIVRHFLILNSQNLTWGRSDFQAQIDQPKILKIQNSKISIPNLKSKSQNSENLQNPNRKVVYVFGISLKSLRIYDKQVNLILRAHVLQSLCISGFLYPQSVLSL